MTGPSKTLRQPVEVKVDCSELGLISRHMFAIEAAAARINAPAFCANIPEKAGIVIDANQIRGMQQTCILTQNPQGRLVEIEDRVRQDVLIKQRVEEVRNFANHTGLLATLTNVTGVAPLQTPIVVIAPQACRR